MSRPITSRLRAAALLLLAAAATSSTASAQQRATAAAPTTAERFDRAWYAWDAGAFDSALVELKRVLTAPDADAYHDRVAELTGEIYSTVEVAKDARAPKWSPDGRFLAYETGAPNARRVHVVRAADGFANVVSADGSGLVFAPDSRSAAWIRSGAGGRPIVDVATLEGGPRREIPIDAAAATQLTLFGRAPVRLAVLTGSMGDTAARMMVRNLADGDGTWRQIAIEGAQPVQLIASPDGSRLVVLTGARGAFARGGPGFAATRVTGFAEYGGGAIGGIVAGHTVTFSRDGRTLGWIENTATGVRFRLRRGADRTTTATEVAGRVQSLALSPTGQTLAFSHMPREDWEIFTAPTDGSAAPTRLTREIQHDLFPQFLADGQLLAVVGEARHRRSHLYDLGTGERTRLFHNNSVRRVAPEYEWVPSPDGSRIAIVSERDGNTITPHRHLYLTELGSKVSRAALIARVDSNLTAERELRENGRRIFAPIAALVRAATEQVSTGRIYENEAALFGFDSKHITQPGNWRATEWLLARYRSYGLDAHLQEFTTVSGREIRVANVVATVKGTVNPELIYLVGAHFDSRAEGPGADDNTSGTAMILEAARIIAKNPLPATVMFVAFTGEEAGLRGSREFARRMKDSIQVVGWLNNDMMGWSNDHRLDNTIRYSNPSIRDVQHAAAIQFSRLTTYDAFYYKSTDAHALFDGWGDIGAGIGSYPILGNPHYHQSHDVLETINHQQLAETSKTTIATIMLMASSPSRLTGLAASGKTATWEPARERGVVRYLVRYGPAEDPMRHSMTVTTPRAVMNNAQAGWVVSVKAVNQTGLEGWDWARAEIR